MGQRISLFFASLGIVLLTGCSGGGNASTSSGSSSTSPSVVGQIASVGIAQDAQVSPDGQTLFIASADTCTTSSCATPAGNGGIYSYSLASPGSPSKEGLAWEGLPGYDFGVYYAVAYSSATKTAFGVNAYGAVQAFNETTPTSPAYIGGFPVSGFTAVVMPNQASMIVTSVVPGSGLNGNPTYVLDQLNITSPATLTVASTISFTAPTSGGLPYAAISPDAGQLLLFSQGYIAVVDTSSGSLGTLTEIDHNSVLTGNAIGAGGLGNGTYIGNRQAILVGTDGAVIVDLTTPSAPVIVGSVSFTESTSLTALMKFAVKYVSSRSMAYVVGQNDFFTLDLSSTGSPKVTANLTLTNSDTANGGITSSIDATPDGKYAYAVSGGVPTIINIP
jgi:hypothetical protein